MGDVDLELFTDLVAEERRRYEQEAVEDRGWRERAEEALAERRLCDLHEHAEIRRTV